MTEQEEKLHEAVLKKIKKDWAKNWQSEQGDFSENFSIVNQDSFFLSLQQQVTNTELSKDSIRRFLKRDDRKRGFQEQTLDFFAQYVSGKNWKEYLEPESRWGSKKWLLTGLIFCILSTCIFFFIKQSNKNQTTKLFETIIKNANKIQLQCYKRLPTFDTTGLGKYYWNNSPAFKDIEKVLTRNSSVRRWTISTKSNASYYDYLGLKINELTDSTAKVTVQEFWHLQYFNADTLSKEEITYKSLTPCACYFLKKINNQWKISECLFTHNVYQYVQGQLTVQTVNVGVCPCQ